MKAVRPGTVFRDGKLYLFEPPQITVLRGWPDLQAWRLTEEHPEWFGVRPDVDFRSMVRRVRDLRAATRKALRRAMEPDWDGSGPAPDSLPGLLPSQVRTARALEAFLQPFPPDVLKEVCAFRSGHWGLLQACARIDDFRFLLQDHPAIAMLLAHLHRFHRSSWPLRTARSLVRRRRRDILGALGFPATRSAVRILGRMPLRSIRPWVLAQLRVLMGEPTLLKTLAHLPRVNLGAVVLLADTDLRPFVAPAMLGEVADDAREDAYPRTAARLAQTLSWWDEITPTPPIARVRDRRALDAAHFAAQVAHIRWESDLNLDAPLPGPPIPGNGGIQPLYRSADIAREGHAQRNCLSRRNWLAEVQRREVYLYRILEPERATFSLVRGADGRWTLDQVESAGNRPVGPETVQTIQDWLARWDHGMLSIRG